MATSVVIDLIASAATSGEGSNQVELTVSTDIIKAALVAAQQGFSTDYGSTDAGAWEDIGHVFYVQLEPSSGTRSYGVPDSDSTGGEGAYANWVAHFTDVYWTTDSWTKTVWNSATSFTDIALSIDLPDTDYILIGMARHAGKDGSWSTFSEFFIEDTDNLVWYETDHTHWDFPLTGGGVSATITRYTYKWVIGSAQNASTDLQFVWRTEGPSTFFSFRNLNFYGFALKSQFASRVQPSSALSFSNGTLQMKFFKTFLGTLNLVEQFIIDVKRLFTKSVISFFANSTDNEIDVDLYVSPSAQIEIHQDSRSS